MATASIAGPLIGRETELAELRTELDRVIAGVGSTVFLSGAAGMGKTALAKAMIDEARRMDLPVLAGRAWPLDAGLAYAPIVQAVGPRLRELTGPARHELVDGLPDLGRLFTELHLADAPALGDPALEKTRLFESVARLLERMTAETPALLFVDDLHYADAATIELLHYLVRRLGDAPILLVGSLRPQSVEGILAELFRHAQITGTARVVDVGPLHDDGLRALADRSLGAKASDDLMDFLRLRTRAAPFFVIAMIATLQREGKLTRVGDEYRLARGATEIIPPEVRQLLAGALEGVDRATRSVVDHLAVGGAEVQYATLASVCPIEEGALLDAIDRLRTRGLVVESSGTDGSLVYVLAHPLAQEVIYEQMSEPHRRAAHRRFLAAASTVGPELAPHVRGVGPELEDPERALNVLLQAAELARSSFAHDDAAKWLSTALALARRYAWTERLPAILEHLGDALAGVGELAAASEVWTEAVALHATNDAASEAAAAIRVRLSLVLWELGRLDRSVEVVEDGIAQFGPASSSLMLAQLYETSFRIALRCGDVEWAEKKADALANWVASSDDPFEIEIVNISRFMAEGRLLKALQASDRASEHAHTLAQRLRCGRYRLGITVASGTIDDQDLAAYATLAQDAGVPALMYALPLIVGHRRFWTGDLQAALAHWEEALADAEATSSRRMRPSLHAYIGITRALCGQLEEAAHEIERARDCLGVYARDVHVAESLGVAQAMLALESNDPSAARRAADSMTAAAFAVWPPCVRAQAWLLGGDIDRAERTAREVGEKFADLEFGRAGAGYVLGLVHIARDQSGPAAAAFAESIEAFDRVGMALFAARARLELAALSTTPKEQARAHAWGCLDVFERAGAQRYYERTRALLRTLGETVVSRKTGPDDAVLSPRELEVARLAAAGKTNAQIGKQLFISPHTAATHMKKIYGRTGVHNRTSLAQWLRDHERLDG